jgi:NAD-dependent dihydropyrimidine dehydrogenase PreA subunit
MSRLAGTVPRVVVFEGRGSRPLEEAGRAALMRALLEGGYSVDCVREDGTPSVPPRAGLMVVFGRFDGAPPSAAAQDAVDVRFEQLEGREPAAVLARVEELREERQVPRPGGWKPWFPVIDYSRCTNCMQCLSFCLFDVYGSTKEGKIQVRNQDNCKTDCPACSRVCPEVAILFPKYRHGPINGDEIQADDLRREAMKVDISALLGGDIYAMLRDRSAKARSRFAKERDEDRALKERQNCLVKLRKQMDVEVPPEVLASLPSPDEIRAKAEAAQARARDALAAAEAARAAGPPEPEAGRPSVRSGASLLSARRGSSPLSPLDDAPRGAEDDER